MNRDRFPGIAGGWARLDGPAGTQMVDVAIAAMADWMRSGRGANHGGVFAAAHATDECVAAARAGLAAIDGVTLYGDPPDRVPTLMFNVAGHDATAVATALAAGEVAVWDGNYYAWELERFLGLDPGGAVRAGFVHYNDASDAERLVEAVRAVAAGQTAGAAAAGGGEPPG